MGTDGRTRRRIQAVRRPTTAARSGRRAGSPAGPRWRTCAPRTVLASGSTRVPRRPLLVWPHAPVSEIGRTSDDAEGLLGRDVEDMQPSGLDAEANAFPGLGRRIRSRERGEALIAGG